MTIRDIYNESITENLYWLQILIEFLVFEKQVHTWDEDKSVLDLYFLPKHHDRMNEELRKYAQKR